MQIRSISISQEFKLQLVSFNLIVSLNSTKTSQEDKVKHSSIHVYNNTS